MSPFFEFLQRVNDIVISGHYATHLGTVQHSYLVLVCQVVTQVWVGGSEMTATSWRDDEYGSDPTGGSGLHSIEADGGKDGQLLTMAAQKNNSGQKRLTRPHPPAGQWPQCRPRPIVDPFLVHLWINGAIRRANGPSWGLQGVDLEKMTSPKQMLCAVALWQEVFFPEHALHFAYDGQACEEHTSLGQTCCVGAGELVHDVL